MYTNWQQPGGYGNPMQPPQYGQPDPNAMYQQPQAYQQWYNYTQSPIPPGNAPAAVDGQPPLPVDQNQPPLPVDTHSTLQPPLPNTAPPLPNIASNVDPPQPPQDVKPPLPPEPPPDDESKKELEPRTVEEVNKLTALQQQALQWQTINQQQPAPWPPQQWPQAGFSQPPPPAAPPPPPGQLNQEWQALLNEEGEFIVQYEQWRKQYDDWKDQNKHHPNQEQFKQYESQWKQYEQQMEEKQAYIQNRKVQLQSQMAAAQFPQPPQSQNQPVNYGQGVSPMPPPPNLAGMPGPVPGFSPMAPPPIGGPGMQGLPPPPSSDVNTGSNQFPPPPSSAGGPGHNQYQQTNSVGSSLPNPLIPPSTSGGAGSNQFPPTSSSSGASQYSQTPISSAQQSQFHSSTYSNHPSSTNQSNFPPSTQPQNSFQAHSNVSGSTAQQITSHDTASEKQDQVDLTDSSDGTQIPGFGEFPSMDKSEDSTSQVSISQSASRTSKFDNLSQGQNRNYSDSSRMGENFEQSPHSSYSNRGYNEADNVNSSEGYGIQHGVNNPNMSQYSFSHMQSDVKTSSGNKSAHDDKHYQNQGYNESGSHSTDNHGYQYQTEQESYDQSWTSSDKYGDNRNFGSKNFDMQAPNSDIMSQQRFSNSFRGPRPPFQGRYEGRPPFRPQGHEGNNSFPFRGPVPPFGNQRRGLLGSGPAGDYNPQEKDEQDNYIDSELSNERNKFGDETERDTNEFDDGRKYPMNMNYQSDNMGDYNRFSDNNTRGGPPRGGMSRFGDPKNQYDGPRGSRFEPPLRGKGFGFRGARFPVSRFDSPYDDPSQQSVEDSKYDESEYNNETNKMSGQNTQSQNRLSGGPGDGMYGFDNKAPPNFRNSDGQRSGVRPFSGTKGNTTDFEEPVAKMSKFDQGFGKDSDYSSQQFSGPRGQSNFGMSRGRTSDFANLDELENSPNQMSRFDGRPGNMSRMGNMRGPSEFNKTQGQSKFGAHDQGSDFDRGFNMGSEFDSKMDTNQNRYGDEPGGQQKFKSSAVPSLLDLDFREPPPTLKANLKKDQPHSDDGDLAETKKDATEKKKEEPDTLPDKTTKQEEDKDVNKEEMPSFPNSAASKSLIDDVKALQKQQQTLQNLQKLEEDVDKEKNKFYSGEDSFKNDNSDDFYPDDGPSEFSPGPRPPFPPGGRFPGGAGAGQMRPGPGLMRPPGPGPGMMRPGGRFPQRGGPFGSQMGPRPPFDRMRGPRPMHQMGHRGGHNFPASFDRDEEPPVQDEGAWNDDNNDMNFSFPERGRGAGRARGMRMRGRARGRGGDKFPMDPEREFQSQEDDMNEFQRENRMDPWNERFERDDAFRMQNRFEDEGYPGPRRVPPHDFPRRDFPGRDFPERDYPERDFPGRDFPDREFPDREFPDPLGRRPEFPGRRDPFMDRERFGHFDPEQDFERRRGFDEPSKRDLDDVYRNDFRDRDTFSPHRDRAMMDRPHYDDREYWDRTHMDDRPLYDRPPHDRPPHDRPPHDRFPPDMPFRERHLLERSRLDSPRPGDRHFEAKELIDYGHRPQMFENEKDSQPYTAPEVIDYGHGHGGGPRDAEKLDDRVDDSERRLRHEKYSRDTGRRDDFGRRDDRSDRERSRNGDRYESAKDGKRPPLFPHERGDKFASKPEPQKIETVKVEDLIYKPGRNNRPEHMVFIMRGLPGAGKTYVSKLIREKELANGGHAPRMLCLDDYFMVEIEKKEKDPETGKMVTRKILDYEYEPEIEDAYRQSLLKSFKKTIDGGLYPFIIFDAVNDRIKHFEEFWSYAKSKGFQVYVAEIQADINICSKRNTHKRSLKELEKIKKRFEDTPKHYLRLDTRGLLQEVSITEVEMEDSANEDAKKKDVPEKQAKDPEDEEADGGLIVKKSKWELETSGEQLDKLDGIRHAKRRRSGDTQTFEDFLQLADESYSRDSAEPGRKRVRWADIEERKDQLRRREIGFVVGQTQRDWERITDNSYADRALNKTKYI